MVLDKIDTFHALEHYGIHVARSEYVDSAEGAIAFASRRTAADERMVPILLRVFEMPGQAEPRHAVGVPHPSDETIRQAYAVLTANLDPTQTRALAQEAVEPGTDVALEGRVDQVQRRKIVTLRSTQLSADGALPLDAAAAESLVSSFRPLHHQPEKNRKMLEHLLLRAAEFFENDDVEQFKLDPLRIHQNTYTVLDASVTVRRPLHLKERLSHHAHDAKEYGFRPSGRQ